MRKNNEQIVAEFTKLGQCIATEYSLGEQLIQLTKEQRQAHQATLAQQDICNNLKNDEEVSTV
jgi:hypothetical protein